MFIFLGGSGEFWLRSFAFFLFAPIIPVLLYQFLMVRNRPDLHPHLLDMPTYGIYNLLYSVVGGQGDLRDEPQQILLDDAVVAAAGGVEEEARVAQMEQVQTTVLAFDAAEREPSPTAIVVTRPTSTSPMFEAR
ncbi:hypothetical protein [Sporisorium scitamineum]|uniref:Uncharacterized protein n=1 Tax=Sporisorium scitamineum TaxID=49012 RepID=A0A0F7SAX8_9BASI|nr:hypothetical protein [Sporisorium scitamineum]